MNTGIDGGMNKVFAAKLPDGNTGLSEGGEGQSLSLLALSRAPGTIPSTRQSAARRRDSLGRARGRGGLAPAPSTRMAAAAPSPQSDGFFSSLARKVGLGGARPIPPPARHRRRPREAESDRRPSGPSRIRKQHISPRPSRPPPSRR